MSKTMRIIPLIIAVFFTVTAHADTISNLGDALRESGWDFLIGTWVDAETQGKINTTRYMWRFEDQVIETTTKESDKEIVSLMGRNPKNEEIYHVSADDKGGSSLGRWKFMEDKATLEVLFITGDKQEGSAQITYTRIDDDTMKVALTLPEPLEIKMVRMKSDSTEK